MPDCPRCGNGFEETVLHAFYYCKRVHPFWSRVGEWVAHICTQQLELHDVSYGVDNVHRPFQDEKRVVFLTILAVARIVRKQNKSKTRDFMTVLTFLMMIWFCSLGINLVSKLDAIEYALTKRGCIQQAWS